MNLLSNLKKIFESNRLYWILFVFGVIFILVSFVNHLTFRTSSDPLGIYSNAIYDYAHFRANDCTLLTPLNAKLEEPFFDNKLSDHFNILQFFIAPFHFIFGTWTLLIFQLLFILIGGVGVHYYFRKNQSGLFYSNLATIHFFSIWGVLSALAFDYHDNVLGVMIIPWFFLFVRDQNWVKATVVFTLMLLSKENVSFWLFFVCFGLAVGYFKSRKHLIPLTFFALSSLLYFFTVTKIVMPSLANEGREYLHFHYSALGEDMGEALNFVLTSPLETIKLMFINHTGDPNGDWIKAELYLVILLSGGVALFLRPYYLIMILPIFGQKVFSDDMLKWGINYHYCIAFVPVLTFALFLGVERTKWLKAKELLILIAVFLTIAITLVKNNTRIAKWHDKSRINFLTLAHYQREFDIWEARKSLDLIPDDEDVIISAHFNAVPHMPFRRTIYEFPVVEDAEYIFLFEGVGTYPISKEEFKLEVHKYRASDDWEILYDQNSTLILKRK